MTNSDHDSFNFTLCKIIEVVNLHKIYLNWRSKEEGGDAHQRVVVVGRPSGVRMVLEAEARVVRVGVAGRGLHG